MYVNKGSGLMQYETLAELLDADIGYIKEFGENYYVYVNYDDQYHNTIWVINKATKNISQMSLIDYLIKIDGNAVEVDPSIIKKI